MGRGKSTKQFSSVFLLLLLGVELSSAWFWPFSSADPEEFKHESVKALTKDNFEDYVRTHMIYSTLVSAWYTCHKIMGNQFNPSLLQVIREDGKYYFVKFYANWCGKGLQGCLALHHPLPLWKLLSFDTYLLQAIARLWRPSGDK